MIGYEGINRQSSISLGYEGILARGILVGVRGYISPGYINLGYISWGTRVY